MKLIIIINGEYNVKIVKGVMLIYINNYISKLMINTLCFSSGCIFGISFIGALDVLVKNDIINLNNINVFVGSSVGSLVAFLLSIKYNIDEIKQLSYNEFRNLHFIYNINNLFINYGLIELSVLIQLLQKLLNDKLNIENITFNELYNLTNNKLIIIGTNYTKNTETIFSNETTPDMCVLTAIKISISVPFIFPPVLYNNEYYIDGGFKNNFPINLCNKETTIGFNIIIKNQLNSTSIFSLIQNTFLNLFANSPNKYTDYNIIDIDINIDFTDIKIFLNLNPDINYLNKIISYGELFTNNYIRKREPVDLI